MHTVLCKNLYKYFLVNHLSGSEPNLTIPFYNTYCYWLEAVFVIDANQPMNKNRSVRLLSCQLCIDLHAFECDVRLNVHTNLLNLLKIQVQSNSFCCFFFKSLTLLVRHHNLPGTETAKQNVYMNMASVLATRL